MRENRNMQERAPTYAPSRQSTCTRNRKKKKTGQDKRTGWSQSETMEPNCGHWTGFSTREQRVLRVLLSRRRYRGCRGGGSLVRGEFLQQAMQTHQGVPCGCAGILDWP